MDSAPAPGDKAGMRILILGGTGEASALTSGLAGRPGIQASLSLAGRTSAPAAMALPVRIGGFGGAEGLARHLAENGIDLLVDATHPFAARISANAALAAAEAGVAILAIRRPAWERRRGDDWREVERLADAPAALGAAPRRVFLTTGRMEVAVFAAAPQHDYLVRTIEPVGAALDVPRLTAILARGPYDEASEGAFLSRERVELLVSKNAGGAATYGKIAAARALGLPVVMVRRPEKPAVASVPDAQAALARILGSGEAHEAAGTLRRV